MKKRKTILCIVEGITDQIALGYSLDNFFSNDDVRFQIVDGDITSRFEVNPHNVISKVSCFVKKAMKLYGLKINDIKQIIHIVDTDGAFVSDSQVQQYSNKKVRYTPNMIYAENPEAIRKRNRVKKANVLHLVSCKVMMKIPYSIYYMSCNLDHVICGNANATQEEKHKAATYFERKHADDLLSFIGHFNSLLPSNILSYEDSWNFIQQGCNSLGQYSNLKYVFSNNV